MCNLQTILAPALLASLPFGLAHAESGADQSALLGGWAGTYTGTGTVIFKEWTTEHAADADIEPFSTVDTTAFEQSVIVAIDTSDDPFSHIFAQVVFEDLTIDIRSFDSVYYDDRTLTIWEAITLNSTVGARFRGGSGSRGEITGEIFLRNHRDLGAIHSDLTAFLSLVDLSLDTAISEEFAPQQSPEFSLHQNLPNPFNSSTAIPFDVDREQWIELSIYNLGGQLVSTLAAGMRTPGRHEVHWDGLSETGHLLASGLYLYRLNTADQTMTRKLLLLR